MNLIVCVDEKWGIGKNNGLLFKLKKDMQFFRETTTDKIVVMGANTFKSFPHGALPNRTNIVLDNSGEEHEGAYTCESLAELEDELVAYDSEDIFVIGGASVYKLMLGYCQVAYVTKVQADGEAEVFFPNLDEMKEWKQVYQGEDVEDNGYIINFCRYERV